MTNIILKIGEKPSHLSWLPPQWQLSADCAEWDSQRGLPKPMPCSGHWKILHSSSVPACPPFKDKSEKLQPCAQSRFYVAQTTLFEMPRRPLEGDTCHTVTELFNWWEAELLWESSSKSFVRESSFKEVDVTMPLLLARTVALPLLAKSLVPSAQHLWFCCTNEFPVGQGLCPGEMSPFWDVQSLTKKEDNCVPVQLGDGVMGCHEEFWIESLWNARVGGRKPLLCGQSKASG